MVTLTRRVLRALEWVANPALAGLAVLLLSIGVVTWLPALAAAAVALKAWREDGDQRCFTGTFAAFGQCWRQLWRHAMVSTATMFVLAINIAFLSGQPSLIAFLLLTAQAGILVALIPYHFALAVTAAPREALLLTFGSPRRGLLLLAAALLAPLVTLPLAVGPLVFGTTVPLLVAIHLNNRKGALAQARVSVPL